MSLDRVHRLSASLPANPNRQIKNQYDGSDGQGYFAYFRSPCWMMSVRRLEWSTRGTDAGYLQSSSDRRFAYGRAWVLVVTQPPISSVARDSSGDGSRETFD